MVPVSTAQTLPSLSSHCVWVSACVQGGKTECVTLTKEKYSLLLLKELKGNLNLAGGQKKKTKLKSHLRAALHIFSCL